MADIPNREASYPAWAAIKENLSSRVAIVEAPTVGRAAVAAKNIQEVPSDIGSPTMNLVYMDVPTDLWNGHNSVTVNGNEYPEYINVTVNAGKTMTINAGQRWLEVSEGADGAQTFNTELPDDVIWAVVQAGGTLNLNADKTNDEALAAGVKDPTTQQFKQYQLGGRDVVVVSGAGTFNADMGDYADHAFVTAQHANVKMGKGNGTDGRNSYSASGNSQGHIVEGGKGADNFQYDFEGQNRTVGTNIFDGKTGATGVEGTDNISLSNLPVGTKVNVQVSAIRGGGTFPDADMDITIKKPDGTVLGTVEGKDMNYLFLVNDSVQGISPKDIGAGGNRTYTVGQ